MLEQLWIVCLIATKVASGIGTVTGWSWIMAKFQPLNNNCNSMQETPVIINWNWQSQFQKSEVEEGA